MWVSCADDVRATSEYVAPMSAILFTSVTHWLIKAFCQNRRKTAKKKRAAGPTSRKEETKGWTPWYGPIYWSSSWRVNCLQDLCRISLWKTKSYERDPTWNRGRECPWHRPRIMDSLQPHSLFLCATLGEMAEEHGWVSRCSSPLAIGNKLQWCPDAKPFLPMTVIGEWSTFSYLNLSALVSVWGWNAQRTRRQYFQQKEIIYTDEMAARHVLLQKYIVFFRNY